MKIVSFFLSLLLSITCSIAQKKPAENIRNRVEKIINSHWTFNYFSSESADKGCESPGFDDSKWPAISLPHTWTSYETTRELRPFTKSPGETGDAYWWTGWGWYRKHFSISSAYADYKVFIEFEGVQKYCKVWINGKYAGDHKGAYGSFDFDITAYIKPGEDNVIAVAVSNLQKDEFRLHSLSEGPHNVSCGIYRNVTLSLKKKLYIPMQGSAAHEGGTFISIPALTEKEAVLSIKTWVKNDDVQARDCILQTTLSDRNSQVIQVMKSETVIAPGQLYMFIQTGKPVKDPHLWSVNDPYLYTVHSEVIDKKDVIDAYTTTVGFRRVRVDENDHAIYINERKTVLTGVNRHQEYPWLGDAVPDWMTAEDYNRLSGKKVNNFVRTADYPGSMEAYKQADINGLIALEDFSAIVSDGFLPEEQKQQIREMIRRDRNHVSIIAWEAADVPGSKENSEFIASEDSTRKVLFLSSTADTCSVFLNYNSKNSVANLSSTGEPSKIILTASHSKIESDRGSIVLITAEISDSKGNHIKDASNTLRWKVYGPARLIGPSYYVSYADSNRREDEGWYFKMPATNIIRSTGKPGKIIVTVFSAGLASGSIELEATEMIPDNGAVIEPPLSDQGRKPVVRTMLVTERLDEVPVEISPASDDIKLAKATRHDYGTSMRDYIKRSNPAVDTTLFEFKTLMSLFEKQLFNNDGNLSSPDYNFNSGHYNTCRLISSYITRTKLPALFKESLRQYYSKLLISQGCEKNAGEEMNWLNWIPSGGVVVIVNDNPTTSVQQGVVFSKQDDLSSIIRSVYPQFTKFSEDARQRALIYISKMNPSVTIQDSGTKYIAEKGKPILIPEFKFISE